MWRCFGGNFIAVSYTSSGVVCDFSKKPDNNIEKTNIKRSIPKVHKFNRIMGLIIDTF
jgi:hypothetical protein